MAHARGAWGLCVAAAAIAVAAACGQEKGDATGANVGGGGGAATDQADSGTLPSNGDSGSGVIGGGDASTSGGKLASGDGYVLAFSAPEGIGSDLRACSATFGGDGLFTGYDAGTTDRIAIGAAKNAAAGDDGVVAWGVWNGGPTTGATTAQPNGAFTFPAATEGFHYAIGKLPTTLPTTGVDYVGFAGSAPTSTLATAPGTFVSASATVDFTSSTIQLKIKVNIGGNDVLIDASAPTPLQGTPKTSFATSDSTSDTHGSLVGPNAERIAVAFTIQAGGGSVLGSAVLARK